MSRKMKLIQVISVASKAMDLYSASVLDLATVGCFLALHERQLGPKNVQNLDVERRGCPNRHPNRHKVQMIQSDEDGGHGPKCH